MCYEVKWSNKARKQLASVPKRRRNAIEGWVKENLDGSDVPTMVGDCKPLLHTQNGWRWRVGSHRVLARVSKADHTIGVFAVGSRQDAYGNLPSR